MSGQIAGYILLGMGGFLVAWFVMYLISDTEIYQCWSKCRKKIKEDRLKEATWESLGFDHYYCNQNVTKLSELMALDIWELETLIAENKQKRWAGEEKRAKKKCKTK